MHWIRLVHEAVVNSPTFLIISFSSTYLHNLWSLKLYWCLWCVAVTKSTYVLCTNFFLLLFQEDFFSCLIDFTLCCLETQSNPTHIQGYATTDRTPVQPCTSSANFIPDFINYKSCVFWDSCIFETCMCSAYSSCAWITSNRIKDTILQLKKNQKVVRPTRSPRQQWHPRRTKNGDFSIFFFSVQGTGGSPTGPDSENTVGDQDTGSPGRPVSSGLQVPGEPSHCRTRTRLPWWTSCGVFPSKYPSIAPAEMINNRRW